MERRAAAAGNALLPTAAALMAAKDSRAAEAHRICICDAPQGRRAAGPLGRRAAGPQGRRAAGARGATGRARCEKGQERGARGESRYIRDTRTGSAGEGVSSRAMIT